MSYFKAKMHLVRFPLGFRPITRWGSLQRTLRVGPLVLFNGPISKGGREKEKDEKRRGSGGNGNRENVERGMEGEGSREGGTRKSVKPRTHKVVSSPRLVLLIINRSLPGAYSQHEEGCHVLFLPVHILQISLGLQRFKCLFRLLKSEINIIT